VFKYQSWIVIPWRTNKQEAWKHIEDNLSFCIRRCSLHPVFIKFVNLSDFFIGLVILILIWLNTVTIWFYHCEPSPIFISSLFVGVRDFKSTLNKWLLFHILSLLIKSAWISLISKPLTRIGGPKAYLSFSRFEISCCIFLLHWVFCFLCSEFVITETRSPIILRFPQWLLCSAICIRWSLA
jgi:hypothetical protein